MVQISMNAEARPSVLFVDDEPAILEGLRHVFRREACEVVTAVSGAAALEERARLRVKQGS
jgi:CheY-like chemotaxis protein